MSDGKLHIHGLADIARVLLYEDVPTCLALLQAIERAPNQVLAFGSEGGEDVIDILLHHADDAAWPKECQRAFRRALAAFRDARATAFFVKTLQLSGDPETRALAASRLALEHPDELHPMLAGNLYGDESPGRARIVAGLLAGSALLKPAERVRVEILSDVPVAEERGLNRMDAQDWLLELGRGHAAETRECLERRGPEAFTALLEHWRSLSEESRAWMLGWGTRVDPLHTVPLLSEALESDEPGRVLAAVEAIPDLGPAAVLFEPALRRLGESPDEKISSAALRAVSASSRGRVES